MTLTEIRTARHHQLNMADIEALIILSTTGSIIMRELAATLNQTASGITVLADRLIRRKLIRRVRNTADRRAIHLQITELGRIRIFQITGTDPSETPAN